MDSAPDLPQQEENLEGPKVTMIKMTKCKERSGIKQHCLKISCFNSLFKSILYVSGW